MSYQTHEQDSVSLAEVAEMTEMTIYHAKRLYCAVQLQKNKKHYYVEDRRGTHTNYYSARKAEDAQKGYNRLVRNMRKRK